MLNLDSLSKLLQQSGGHPPSQVAEFSLGGVTFANRSQASLMGVVNLSSDSWYRESVCRSAEAAIARGKVLAAQGAQIIDVGAESTLAEAKLLSQEGQQSALLPVVQALSEAGILVSGETYHLSVTRAALEAGARILNLTGTHQTQELFELVAKHEAGVIICFVEGSNVRNVSDRTLLEDPIPMLMDYFGEKITEATRCGVRRIWIDPGMGFYYRNLADSQTRIRHQMQVFLNTFRLSALGWPVCHALPHAFECFEEEVRTAESFFAVLALLSKTHLLRTHEVAKVRGVLRTMQLY